MVDQSLHQLAEIELAKLWALHPIRRKPTLDWAKLRTTAGCAMFGTNSIRLSEILITDEERLISTLKHEYAHLLAFDRHGAKGRGHGPAWRQAMQDLGVPAEVYHTYLCQRNKPRQLVVLKCRKCGEMFRRARRLPKGRRFVHAACGGKVDTVQVLRVQPGGLERPNPIPR